MIRRHPAVASLAAVTALALVLLASAAVAARPAGRIVPAPPPALCRTAPSGGWAPVSSTAPVPDLTAYQDYRAALDLGTADRGAGVTVADVEYSWRQSHLELRSRGLPVPPPNTLPDSFRAIEHGTAVLGLIGGAPDGQGITGLAALAGLQATSPYATGVYDPAAAVARAAAGLSPGDVLLVELQGITPSGTLVPIEWEPTVRDAIRTVVQHGVTVVEPAGNGNIDLASLSDRPWLAGPDAPGATGALMVGAGGSPTDASGASDLRRVGGSNWGARVDVQGVGAAVVTSGYGDGIGGTGDSAYTSCFDGTSSAAATVAAAVAALQSGAAARGSSALTPSQVRAVLRSTGLPQVAPDTGPIGPRPQIEAALRQLAGAPPPVNPGTTAPLAAPVVAPTGSATKVARLTLPSAARGASAAFSRRTGRLVIRLRGLVPGATVTAAGARRRVTGGKVILTGMRPGRIRLVVTAPAQRGAAVRPFSVVVLLPAAGGRARIVPAR